MFSSYLLFLFLFVHFIHLSVKYPLSTTLCQVEFSVLAFTSGFLPQLVWLSGWLPNQMVTGLIPSLGHIPGLRARSPVGGTWEATTHRCFSPSLSLLLLLSKKNSGFLIDGVTSPLLLLSLPIHDIQYWLWNSNNVFLPVFTVFCLVHVWQSDSQKIIMVWRYNSNAHGSFSFPCQEGNYFK